LSFRSASWQIEQQHEKWIELLHSIMGMLRKDLSGSAIAPQAEIHEDSSSKELSGSAIASQAEVPKDSRSIGEIIYDRAVDVWPRPHEERYVFQQLQRVCSSFFYYI